MKRTARILIFAALMLMQAGCGVAPNRVLAPSTKSIHTVAAGENLYQIGRKYFVSTLDLIEANSLEAPYGLRLGQRLHIPRLRVHTIVAGETLSGIAEEYRVSLYALTQLNQIPPPYGIVQGKKLKIPSSRLHEASLLVKVAQPETTRLSVVIQAPKIRGERVVEAPPPHRQSQSPPAQPIKRASSVSKASAGGAMIWPLQGRVISSFGSKSHGVRNDGINIIAKLGSAVQAVADGTVVYAGDKLSGFGHILILRHKSGLMSAYAHNQALLVQRGDRVQQGQVIARSGKSGNVTRAQLHFEVREGTRPVDPLRYLPS